MITQFDIDYAAAILRKYYKSAKEKNKQEAIKDLTKVMLTFDALYQVAKEKGEIKDEEKKSDE